MEVLGALVTFFVDDLGLKWPIGANQRNMMAMMGSIQQHLKKGQGDRREKQFLSRALVCLTTVSQQQVPSDPWTITSFDVEFGIAIGVGGL
jgi:hypothetical protein